MVDVQAGVAALIGELRGMAAAVAGLQQAAVPATPVARSQCKQSPGPMSNQLELVTPRGTSKRAAEQSPKHPVAKCQQIEDSEDELIAGQKDVAQQQQMQQLQQQGLAWENSRLSVRWTNVRGMSNSREVIFPSFSSVEPGVVNASDFAGGLAGCAELSVPLEEVTRNLLKETVRNPVDLRIPSELCKIVVYTDGGAAFRPGEGAVASWGFVAVLMCGNEAVCVIGCASGQVVLDRSHP